jgi:hypothetical protein
MCSARKVRPPSIVAPIQRRAFRRSRRADAATAMTIVKLEANRQSVITVEKMMLG